MKKRQFNCLHHGHHSKPQRRYKVVDGIVAQKWAIPNQRGIDGFICTSGYNEIKENINLIKSPPLDAENWPPEREVCGVRVYYKYTKFQPVLSIQRGRFN